MLMRRDRTTPKRSTARSHSTCPRSARVRRTTARSLLHLTDLAERERINIAALTPNDVGKTVLFRARINTSRAQSAKLLFLNLRQKTASIQGLMNVQADKVSKQMVKWSSSLLPESIVLVEGA